MGCQTNAFLETSTSNRGDHLAADIFSPTVAPHFALLCFIVDHIKYIWIKNNFKMMGNLIARKSTYGVNAQLRLRDAKEPAMPTV